MNVLNQRTKNIPDVVCLQGGLGNQLFQLNYAFQASCTRIKLVRKEVNRDLDYLLGLIQEKVEVRYVTSTIQNYFLGHYSRYLLHFDVNPSKLEKLRPVKFVALSLANACLRVTLWSKVSIILESNICRINKSGLTRLVFIGYFQRLLSNETDFDVIGLSNLPLASHAKLDDYIRLARTETPLIVHFRFGDYIGNSKFTALSQDYYLRAIDTLSKEVDISNIWVFSNDLDTARKYFKAPKASNIRWFDSVLDSDSATLEVMRFGSAFVIANSTFSWWAATLRYNPDCPVIAPLDWYSDGTEFQIPIPTSWKRL